MVIFASTGVFAARGRVAIFHRLDAEREAAEQQDSYQPSDGDAAAAG
ncbi:MAG: hypothetical protein WDO18_04565 [Acidobacteriota bacterium]